MFCLFSQSLLCCCITSFFYFPTGSKQEGKENSSDESNIVKERFAMSESNGKLSKSEIFTCSSISTSTDKTVSSSSKTCATESNYFTSFTEKKPDDL